MKAQGSASGQHAAVAQLALIFVFLVGVEAAFLLVMSSHPLHGARDLLRIVPLQRNAQQMATFETAAKGLWMCSTMAKRLGFQSRTDCLKASLPTDCTELVHCAARPFVAGNISFSGEKCAVVPVEECGTENSKKARSLHELRWGGLGNNRGQREHSQRQQVSVSRGDAEPGTGMPRW